MPLNKFQRKIKLCVIQFSFTEILEKYNPTLRRDEGIHLNSPPLL